MTAAKGNGVWRVEVCQTWRIRTKRADKDGDIAREMTNDFDMWQAELEKVDAPLGGENVLKPGER